MSTFTLPGMDDFGTRVQAFAASRGMRKLRPGEVERLNGITEAEARIVLSYYRRIGLAAGIVEAYLEKQGAKEKDARI